MTVTSVGAISVSFTGTSAPLDAAAAKAKASLTSVASSAQQAGAALRSFATEPMPAASAALTRMSAASEFAQQKAKALQAQMAPTAAAISGVSAALGTTAGEAGKAANAVGQMAAAFAAGGPKAALLAGGIAAIAWQTERWEKALQAQDAALMKAHASFDKYTAASRDARNEQEKLRRAELSPLGQLEQTRQDRLAPLLADRDALYEASDPGKSGSATALKDLRALDEAIAQEEKLHQQKVDILGADIQARALAKIAADKEADAAAAAAEAVLTRAQAEQDRAASSRRLSEMDDAGERVTAVMLDRERKAEAAQEQMVYDEVSAAADLHGAVLERQGDADAQSGAASGDLAAAFAEQDAARAASASSLTSGMSAAQSLLGQAPGPIGDAVNGASTGIAIGMMFGPLGAAIGGVVGGLGGMLTETEAAQEAFTWLDKTMSNFGDSIGDLLGDLGNDFMEWANGFELFAGIIETEAEKRAAAARADAANAAIDSTNAEHESAMAAYFDSLIEESRALEDNTEALREVSESFTNIPRGYRVALGMYQSETPTASAGVNAAPSARTINNGPQFYGPVTIKHVDDETIKRATRASNLRDYGTPDRPRGGSVGN